MRVRILGCGWYGAHVSASLIAAGHDVEIHECADRIFAGASGANPARLHLGFHYPRSRLTRAACQDHQQEFLRVYSHLTRAIQVNIYAIAAHDSLVDFGTYCQVLRGEVEFVRVDPAAYDLRNLEGAVLTGERHIVIEEARKHFAKALDGFVRLGREAGSVDDPAWDLTIDCSFAANDAENIDRYEPCVMALLEGPTGRATTVMDGAFPSVFPWNEAEGLSSLTSASLTPLSKTCKTYGEAKAMLAAASTAEINNRCRAMLEQMTFFWPAVREEYRIVDYRTSIRAMPRSGADARLVDVIKVGERALRIRAGKIDAIFAAERIVKEMISA